MAAITKAEGSVSYDWERGNGKFVSGGGPWAPRWLVDGLGVDYFGSVAAVNLSGSATAGDRVLEQVGLLTATRTLDLEGSWVSDAVLRHLKSLTNLTSLSLARTKVTAAGLANLEGCDFALDRCQQGAQSNA